MVVWLKVIKPKSNDCQEVELSSTYSSNMPSCAQFLYTVFVCSSTLSPTHCSLYAVVCS